jgi:hypothetical protein
VRPCPIVAHACGDKTPNDRQRQDHENCRLKLEDDSAKNCAIALATYALELGCLKQGDCAPRPCKSESDKDGCDGQESGFRDVRKRVRKREMESDAHDKVEQEPSVEKTRYAVAPEPSPERLFLGDASLQLGPLALHRRSRLRIRS